MAGLDKLKKILDYLRVPSRRKGPIEDAYNAGYTNVVHRAVGDIKNPGLYYKLNANVGAHADLAGGKQAQQILDSLKSGGLSDPGVMTLLARARRPYLMSDGEINDPLVMYNTLNDKKLLKEVNQAQFRHPDKMVQIPVGSYDDPDLPLFKVLNRRAAERALNRKGYDAVIYPNEIEGAHYGDSLNPMSLNQMIDDAVWSSPKKREELARMMWENASPDPEDAVNKWFNPSMTTIDYSSYRDPWGELLNKRDYTTKGYRGGGLASLRR